MRAYKVAEHYDERVIVTLEIPSDAITNIYRESVVVMATAKHRANKAFVVNIKDDEGNPTIVKIARNNKGLAQNEAELEVLQDGYVQSLGIVIPLIDYDKKNSPPVWIQTAEATQINQKRLEELLHVPNTWYLMYGVRDLLGQDYIKQFKINIIY